MDASPTYATLAQHSHDPVPTFLLRYLLLSVDTVRIYHLICHTSFELPQRWPNYVYSGSTLMYSQDNLSYSRQTTLWFNVGSAWQMVANIDRSLGQCLVIAQFLVILLSVLLYSQAPIVKIWESSNLLQSEVDRICTCCFHPGYFRTECFQKTNLGIKNSTFIYVFSATCLVYY